MTKLERLARRLGRELPGLELRRGEPMSRHTTFRVGGPAELMALPEDEGQLCAAARLAAEEGVLPLPVGNGSNLLVDDAGLDGFVLKTVPKVGAITGTGNTLTAGAGAKPYLSVRLRDEEKPLDLLQQLLQAMAAIQDKTAAPAPQNP